MTAVGFTVPLQLELIRERDRWLVDDFTVAGFGGDELTN